MKNKVGKLFLVSLALVVSGLIAGCTQQASADSRSNSADIAFTKWVTTGGTAPVMMNMEGVVSGDAGAGKYAGEVLEYNNPTAPISTLKADYHINGKAHQFTARVNVTLDNGTGKATIKGVVTDGWMKGADVSGGFQVIAPSGIINAQQGVGGDVCYQGTLHLK